MLTNGQYLERIEHILEGKEKLTARQRDSLLLMGLHQVNAGVQAVVKAIQDVDDRMSAHTADEMEVWADFHQRLIADGAKQSVTFKWLVEKLAAPAATGLLVGVIVYFLTH